MGIANKHGYILLNTTNKSEAAVGYGTLYGDMCGALSVLGDVYKSEVYALARYLNALSPVIPESILIKEPSAELRPGQKDSDSLPPYEVLDQILEMYIERRLPINHIVKSGFDSMLIKKIIRMVQASEFKRYQMAPVLRISPKAFGYGRRMPLVECFNPPASSSE
jgi:NAD+ synthase (glutamine-hydrolysing)